jgi:hypothetical protein
MLNMYESSAANVLKFDHVDVDLTIPWKHPHLSGHHRYTPVRHYCSRQILKKNNYGNIKGILVIETLMVYVEMLNATKSLFCCFTKYDQENKNIRSQEGNIVGKGCDVMYV